MKFGHRTPKDAKQEALMIIVSKWKLECNGFVKGIRCYRVIAEDEIPCSCPDCVGKLIKKGWRTRFLTRTKKGATEDDYFPHEKICLLIQRRKCRSCGTIHHELPNCVVPYKRLSLEIIEDIIKHPEKPTLIEAETVARLLAWWILMAAYILRVAPSIKEKHKVEITPEKNLAEIVRALAHSHLWPGTRKQLTGVG